MDPEFKRALENGSLIFKNVFETHRGEYILAIVKYHEEFYICKYKNRKLTFVNKLNNMKEVPI